MQNKSDKTQDRNCAFSRIFVRPKSGRSQKIASSVFLFMRRPMQRKHTTEAVHEPRGGQGETPTLFDGAHKPRQIRFMAERKGNLWTRLDE